MALIIPDADRVVIRSWLEMDHTAADNIIQALSSAKATLRAEDLAFPLAAAGLSESEATKLLAVFLNMVGIARRAPNVERAQYPAEIYETVSGTSFDALNSEEQARITARVYAVLDTHTLQTTAKASTLQADNQRSYTSGRIISDLRLVFREDTLQPDGAMVVHHLKISFRERIGGPISSMFFALDHHDLEQLQQTIGRALAKDVALREFAERAEVIDLEHRDP